MQNKRTQIRNPEKKTWRKISRCTRRQFWKINKIALLTEYARKGLTQDKWEIEGWEDIGEGYTHQSVNTKRGASKDGGKSNVW